MAVRVKVCGLTRVQDAEACAAAGVDAIGLNFWAQGKRYVKPVRARAIADAVRGRTRIVGLFVDADQAHIEAVRDEVGLECVQLHGDEGPELLAALGPHAFKALRVRDERVQAEAARYPAELLLLDAFVPGQPGGTGARFDWALARSLAADRKVVVAGGLTPDNVAESVRQVQPYGVDVASGVESAPGVKDAALVERFVRRAKSATLTG